MQPSHGVNALAYRMYFYALNLWPKHRALESHGAPLRERVDASTTSLIQYRNCRTILPPYLRASHDLNQW